MVNVGLEPGLCSDSKWGLSHSALKAKVDDSTLKDENVNWLKKRLKIECDRIAEPEFPYSTANV